MSPIAIFLLALVLLAVGAGPFYMRMLAHGAKPDAWWRGRRNGAFWVGLALLVAGGVFYLVGGLGPVAFALLLLVSAAFLLSAAAYCQLALRRLASRGDDARGREAGEGV